VRDNRYSLCIGTFGAIPIDCDLKVSDQQRINGSGSPSSVAKICSLALQAQPQQVESIVDHVENSSDVGQFHLFEKKPKPRWRGKAKQALSPLSAAMHQVNNMMPEMWDPIPENCGVSRRDGKEASALLVFSYQAEKTIEAFPSVLNNRA
jgi:hypothetical protein